MASLERYAGFCGPAVFASFFGVSRMEAARFLESIGARADNGTGTWTSSAVAKLGGRTIYVEDAHNHDLQTVGAAHVYRWESNTAHYRRPAVRRPGTKNKPTISQWLRAHPEGEYFVCTKTHVMHVKDGAVVEDNGNGGSRGRLTRIMPLDDVALEAHDGHGWCDCYDPETHG